VHAAKTSSIARKALFIDEQSKTME